MKILNRQEALETFSAFQKQRNYAAMYSSIYGGIVKDPELMFIPIDDHIVHRGDGIFEAFRFSKNGIFLLHAHLERLFKSAELIGLDIRWTFTEIEKLSHEVVQASGLGSGQVRIFVSRGPGDFSPNPYSTVGSQLYIVAMPFKPMDSKLYEKGAQLTICTVAVKPSIFAQVKSCNYLPNVLMKKEAVDRGADFAVNFTSEGHLAEGPTENILILDRQRRLVAPRFEYTLKGTTLLEVLRIATELGTELGLTGIGTEDISLADLQSAKEIMMVGTTLEVLPVTSIDQVPVGEGAVGPVARRLRAELAKLL